MEEIAKLLPNSSTKRAIKKGSIILCQGEAPRQAYIVLSGHLKMYRLNDNFEEQIANFKVAGDIFPECWIFGVTSNTMYYYEALENSEILTIEKSVLLDLIEKRPDLKNKLFDYMIKNYTGLMVQISALKQSCAAEKILLTIYYLMLKYGENTKTGEYSINIERTHTIIASLIGLTRETTTTELGKLKRKGIIHYDTQDFIIYEKALKKKLGENHFYDIKLN